MEFDLEGGVRRERVRDSLVEPEADFFIVFWIFNLLRSDRDSQGKAAEGCGYESCQ
jgi:hypothetical protein